MKYITFAVPCYNSENYMRRCVDSLLIGGKDVEIILIDDGSSDRTAQIADEYEIEYPDIVRVVHKENGGHGSGVNKGLELANGIYYKVVDSDDWFDKESYQKLLVKLKAFTGERPDLIVCNYVYDHLDEGIKKSMDYKNVFPIEKQCTWDEIGKCLKIPCILSLIGGNVMKNNDEILIGACTVYMYEFTGTEIPEHATIETEEHDVGHCSSGFTVNYKPTKYDVKNQYGQIVRSAITEEEISAKTGVLSWNLANMSLLSTGVYTEDKEGKKKDLIFTGDGKALKTVLLRAVHTKENGKKIRFTMIGQGGSGFAITWENKEVTIDAELTAIKKVKGFLASFEEELTDEEAAAIVAA